MKNMSTLRRKASGFTIVEVLVVLVVVVALISLTVFTYTTVLKSQHDTRRTTDLTTLGAALDKYYTEYGDYPVTCMLSTGLNSNCSNLSSVYTGGSTPDTMTPGVTIAQLKVILPKLDDTFGDPTGSKSGVALNKIDGGVVQPNAYYLASPDMMTGSFSQSFLTKKGTTFTCNFNATDANYAGDSDDRPHPYVVGMYSEAANAWKFYYKKASVDENILNWNTTSNSSCEATELGAS